MLEWGWLEGQAWHGCCHGWRGHGSAEGVDAEAMGKVVVCFCQVT